MTANHALPPPGEWAGREITPDNYAHDWETGRIQKKLIGHLIWLK